MPKKKRSRKEAAEASKPKKITTGKKKPDLDRRFDKTQLKETGHGQTVHRDYAAHFFRWSWAKNWGGPGAKMLDVGCGQDQPMIKVLCNSLSTKPDLWVGVDLNKIKKKSGCKWARVYDEFNVVDHGHHLKKFDDGIDFTVASCFEVIEHMHKDDGRRLLRNLRDLIEPLEGRILLSTPNYDGKHMAANHIHEYYEAELQELIESVGLEVVGKHGTFMNKNVLKKVCSKQEWELLLELNKFHSYENLATFMAPKFPSHSRNIAWILKRAEGSKCQGWYYRESIRKAKIKKEKNDRAGEKELELDKSQYKKEVEKESE